jgi:hypothetical protein
VPEIPVSINRQAGEIQTRVRAFATQILSKPKGRLRGRTSSFEGRKMTRSSTRWWRLAALGAIGWFSVASPAWAQKSSAGPRPAQLAAEVRAGSSLSHQPSAAGEPTPSAAPAAPAKPTTASMESSAKAAAAHATAQRTVYQQPQNTQNDPNAPPAPPSNRLLNQYDTANRAYMPEPLAPPSQATTGPVADGCTSCTSGSCDVGGCSSCNCAQCCDPYFYNDGWFAGADYWYLRPNFSSPVAAVEQLTVVDPNTNASVRTTRAVDYDIGYDSTFRVFGGYRWGECGEALQFSYWQVDTGESFTSQPATQSLFFAGIEEVLADGPGEVLRSNFDVKLDVFDIEYTKRIPVRKGGPSSCGQCCPAWDWAWSLGARIADFERHHSASVADGNGVVLATGDVERNFTGAGPRAGIEGRRYFGDGSKWSAYGATHWSLLLGDFENSTIRRGGNTSDIGQQDFIRTVPVMEIEVGLARQIGCNTLFSAGYQFQAWWELGGFDTILVGDCECQTSSNVLSFDGLFVRLEHTFGGGPRRTACR